MSSMYPPFNGQSPRCMRCGAPLSPGTTNCLTCGLPIQQAYAPGMTSGQAFSSGPSWAVPPPQPPIGSGQFALQGAPPVNNGFGQPSPVVPAPIGMQPAPFAPGFPSANAPVANTTSQQWGTYTPPPNMLQSNIPWNGPMQQPAPEREKQKPRIGLIILTLVLLLVLASGGIGGYLYVSRQQQSNVTPTPIKIVTPSVTPLFSDNFTDNHNNWDLTSTPGKFTVSIANGSMILEDDQKTLFTEVLPGNGFADFRLDINAKLSKGDRGNGFGVFIRGAIGQDGNLDEYYRFELYGDSTFAIFKGYLDVNGQTQNTRLKDYTGSSAILPEGQFNHVTIIAQGSKMTFEVNGVSLFTFTDTAYKTGEVALFVSNLPSLKAGAQAIFTNLAIFPAA